MKDDVRMPEGEVGAKINKMFKVDEKETRRFCLDQILKERNN
jgi:hypothetical protein